MTRLLPLALSILAMSATPVSSADDEIDLSFSDVDAPEHDYWNRPLRDPFTRIKDDLEQGLLLLDHGSEKAFVESLLAELGIPASSQMLVYSTTSLQLSLISPRSPRALYFNEDVYLGWVPGGKIEIVSIDPEIGGVFYIFDIPKNGGRPVVERSKRCMNCHSDEDTRHVPGIVIKSVIPGTSGGSLESYRRAATGHQIPLEERFGGWHVTGGDDLGKHWGNLVGRFTPEGIVTTPVPPGERFDWSTFPVRTSDVLPHLLHEHQAGFVNRALEAHYRARTYLERGRGRLSPEDRKEMDRQADSLVRYLLFADEAELPPAGVAGDDRFKEDFLADRRATREGVSLKDFDLKDRLFKYRCSYMIHGAVFRGLPDGFKRLIYRRLAKALDGESPDPEYAYLPDGEKAAIREILRQTVPDLGEAW
ncbi:MAG: hypothetical protein WD342_13110 [Verrucomicrobiales bacterium]